MYQLYSQDKLIRFQKPCVYLIFPASILLFFYHERIRYFYVLIMPLKSDGLIVAEYVLYWKKLEKACVLELWWYIIGPSFTCSFCIEFHMDLILLNEYDKFHFLLKMSCITLEMKYYGRIDVLVQWENRRVVR